MDLLLHYADEFLLDRFWAHILPASAFVANTLDAQTAKSIALNGTTTPQLTSASAWSHLISYIPHPPLSVTLSSPAALSTTGALVSAWPRDYFLRQILSIFFMTWAGIIILYFIFAYMSYRYIFNHDMMKHPRFLKDQVKQEIQCSLHAFPYMTIFTLPWFQAEVMGYSKLYSNVSEYGWGYFFLSIVWFLVFTDFGIYLVHRGLHHPLLYKTFHKPHHKWIIPTPFASHAFHPFDGYAQSVPYHLFVFLFPLHRWLYLGLFVIVNFWSIFIHDSDMLTGHPLEKVINGPAHHTLHHLYFTVNYGQYFTWADRAGGSYRQPEAHLDPLLEIKSKGDATPNKKDQ